MDITKNDIDNILSSGNGVIFNGYVVTKTGRVISLNYKRKGMPKDIKLQPNRNGYLRAPITYDNKQHFLFVYRLVAKLFLPNPEKYPEINHKNEKRDDNRLENLEWCNRAYNISYGTCRKRAGISRCRRIKQVELNGRVVKIWESIKSTQDGGFNIAAVCSCARKRLKTHSGYKWEYIN